jgi:hypothetical protein
VFMTNLLLCQFLVVCHLLLSHRPMKFHAAPDSDHKFCSECKITELVVRVAAEYLEICGEKSLWLA